MPSSTNHPPSSPQIRAGDPVRTLPCSGDALTGRCIAVHRSTRSTLNSQPSTYYRVRFSIVSPYFGGCHDVGVMYREHELALATETTDATVRTKLPPRPKSTKTQ